MSVLQTRCIFLLSAKHLKVIVVHFFFFLLLLVLVCFLLLFLPSFFFFPVVANAIMFVEDVVEIVLRVYFVVCLCCKMFVSVCVRMESEVSSSCVLHMATHGHVIIAFLIVLPEIVPCWFFCRSLIYLFNYLLSYCFMSVILEGSVEVGCDQDLVL